MKRKKEFPFHKASRITSERLALHRKAIEVFEGKKRPVRLGRPPKSAAEKYVPVSVRLHPRVLTWLKRESKKRALPYQTIINQVLFDQLV